MKRRFVSAVLALGMATGALAFASTATAQEIQLTGPLKGATAVRELRLYREGRLEISPTVSFTLLDEYRRTILFGGQLNYAIKDWLAIGAWGAYGAISTETNLTTQINTVAPRDQLTATNVIHNTAPFGNTGTGPNFADQTAQIKYMIAPQLTFIPFRGKLAIFNKVFVDSDLYIAGGVAFVGIDERKPCGGANQLTCNQPDSFLLGAQTKIAPTFAVGFKFYPANFWSLGVEYRAVPFSWNRAGFDTRGSGPNGNFPDGQVNGQDDTFKFNQLVTVAIGFYLPTQPKLSD
jgi:outer membrane beta-barrel protein